MRPRILVALVVLLMVLAAPAWAAEGELVVRSADTADFPEIELTMMLPPGSAAGSTPAFAVTENGVEAEVVSAQPLGEDRESAAVLLLIDTSGSMSGEPLANARDAAARFIAAMGVQDVVMVAGFGEKSTVVLPFSRDEAELRSALAGLEASGETALYDALLVSAKSLGAVPQSHRIIVLLSDGGDTVSRSSLDDAVTALRDAGITVFAVGLESPEASPAPLASIAEGTGGRVMATAEPAEVGTIFEGIAAEIQNQYVVGYRSNSPQTKDLEIDVVMTAGGSTNRAETVLPNPRYAQTPVFGEGIDRVRDEVSANPLYLTAAVAFVFFSVALLVGGVLALAVRGRRPLDQLRLYDQIRDSADALEAQSGPDAASGKMREAVTYVAGKRGFTEWLRARLERAGLPLRPGEYIYAHVLTVVAVGVAAQLLGGRFLISVALVLLTVVVPLFALEVAVSRRTRAFEEQLPEVLSLVAGSLRAGWGLMQAIDLVVEEMGSPASDEFRRVQTEVRLGLPVESALEKMADRLGSDDFSWTVAAINIQRDVGGNLAEVLDIVSDTMRGRTELRRHVQALTAEGRFSAVILLALPFLEGAVLMTINPGYIGRLFTHPVGVMLAAVGALLLVIGAVWLARIARIEV